MNVNNQTYNYSQWFREIKEELLISEPQNIAARAQCCQNIINESISHLNMQLGLKQLQNNQSYKCQINARLHLKFLINWPGLRIPSDSSKAPRSKREYEKKAKNWLNGRRAPNYGKTLFPQFISEAEQYANKVTKYLLSDSKRQSLYYKILIYKILAQLCGCSVSLNEQAKKAPFFCKNSIERKGKLKEILQAYAYDHQYIQGFPSCFEEAIDYFENKSNQYFAQYRKNYISQNNNIENNKSDNNTNNNNNTSKIISKVTIPKIEKKSIVIDNDGDTVINNNNNNNNNNNIQNELAFWKAKTQNLQQRLDVERNERLKIEKERDNLQQLFNLLQSNMNIFKENVTTITQNNNNNNNNKNSNVVSTHTNSQLPIIPTPIQYGIIATPPKQFNATYNNTINNYNTTSISPSTVPSVLNVNNVNTINAFRKSLSPTQNNNNNQNNNSNNNNNSNGNRTYGTNQPSLQTLQNLQTLHNLQSIQHLQAINNINNVNNNANNVNNNNNNYKIGEQMAASLLRILQSE